MILTTPLTPLLAWLLIQSTAIALAALRIPLWAQAPIATEFEAVQLLICAQIIGATLLFPRLRSSASLAILMILSSMPFTVAATFLAAQPQLTAIKAISFIGAWIGALWLSSLPFSSTQGAFRASAILSVWVIAGPILMFIKTEYGAPFPQNPRFSPELSDGPLLTALDFVKLGRPVHRADLLPLIFPLAAALLVLGSKKLAKRIQRPSDANP